MEDVYPLTPVQGGFLFHSLYEQDDTYFEQVQCRIKGRLDVAAFRNAWQILVDRHAVLRTYFVWQGLLEPMQVVCDRAKLTWQQWDLQGCSVEEQQFRWQEFLEVDRRKGFDLSAPPLMRLTLAQTGACVYEFAWSHPHILLDGWSVQLLLNELLISYSAFVEGKPPCLPEVRPYRDFVAWLQSQDANSAEEFWRERLRGLVGPSELAPMISNASGKHERGFGEESLRISAESGLALRSMADRYRVTINSIVQGAWALVVSHYCAQHDVLFGAVVSGRPAELPGVESIVGFRRANRRLDSRDPATPGRRTALSIHVPSRCPKVERSVADCALL
jgi:hypothetical protein